MNAPRVHVLLAFLIVCCLPGMCLRVERQVISAQELLTTEEPNPDTEGDTQLRLNRTTLLESKSEKNRVDAATLLLFSEKPAAREILLDVLRRTDNPLARKAVCEAFNPVQVRQKSLKDKEDFVKPLVAILLTAEEDPGLAKDPALAKDPTLTKDPALAKAAAEALLIFGYSQVQTDLEEAVTNPALSLTVRLNVIYALKRQPDRAAVAKLVTLLDSPEAQVAEAARAALASIGIMVGSDPAARQRLLAELQGRGAEAFLRERVILQETHVRELETDLSAWQKRLLAALSGWYDSLANDTAKKGFLGEQLKSQEIVMRLWALDKLQELRNAKGALKLSELEASLPDLISDPSRQVRLRTARLLAQMGELDVAKRLLEQLNAERDDQVRREIFVALGEACYVGSLAATGPKVPDEVRKETLEWAVRFLGEAEVEKVRSGAEVMGKLLEQDGFRPDEVGRYLTTLLDRYTQAPATADPTMRGSLLGAMARLCAARSTCRDQAVKLYNGLFEQALGDKAEVVRQNAMDGLMSIDKTAALRKFRENMADDPSGAIQLKLLDLAGEIGGPQDLEWLAQKLSAAKEGEPAWQAMWKIFRRSDWATLTTWGTKIEALAAAGKVVTEQRIAFATLVEQKAKSENRADLLKDAQSQLAQLYLTSNNFKQAAEYLKGLLDVAATDAERQRLQGQLLRTYLCSANMDLASALISKCLMDKNLDLSSNGFLVKSIEESLSSPATADPGAILGALRLVNVRDARTLQDWNGLLSRWSEKFAKAKKPEESGRIN